MPGHPTMVEGEAKLQRDLPIISELVRPQRERPDRGGFVHPQALVGGWVTKTRSARCSAIRGGGRWKNSQVRPTATSSRICATATMPQSAFASSHLWRRSIPQSN